MIEKIEDDVIFGLINTGANRELLKEVPHRQFLDLSVIYYMADSMDPGHIKSRMISNSMLETAGISEQYLFLRAKENMLRISPPNIAPMDEILIRLSDGKAGAAEDPLRGMWVITNNRCFLGAAYILYGDLLQDLAELSGEDLYILPSSIHEVIAIPASDLHPDELRSMVEQVNMELVDPDERLSGNVYCYNRDLRALRFVPGQDPGNSERGTYGD